MYYVMLNTMPESNKPVSYEEKFNGLIELCQRAKENDADLIVVNNPQVLGDNYEELIESLSRISEAGLKLFILPPNEEELSN
jgi:hypothetical protein